MQVCERGKVQRRKNDGEMIDVPYLPVQCYLKARASDPPRTWTSALFAGFRARGGEAARLAEDARDWALKSIRHLAADPKGHDDPETGGEYFAAWLREVHREIYDDI